MAKQTTKKESSRYVCSDCGFQSTYQVGKCPSCGKWGTIEEEKIVVNTATNVKIEPGQSHLIADFEVPERLRTGIGELDRVLGGGLVPGEVVLLGGQPGIGKSTLLLQVCGKMAQEGHEVLYISAEESLSQIGLRAKRLGTTHPNIKVCCNHSIEQGLALVDDQALVIVDSVQAMRSQDEGSWAGTPNQVRAVAQRCIDEVKEKGIAAILVGHITKDGKIAGPMLMEHMVDAVLLFSGDNSSVYRTLRATKNRHGSTDEMAVFQMDGLGLSEVKDPSLLYWQKSDQSVPGVAMTVLMEGTRPLVAELQALASDTVFPYPKRSGVGVSMNKILMLLAVLQSRCAVNSARFDVYCNVTGNLEMSDRASDLAIACSLYSAIKSKPLKKNLCLIGEVGLAGELRPVSSLQQRVKEAARLGFTHVLVSSKEKLPQVDQNVTIMKAATLAEALYMATIQN